MSLVLFSFYYTKLQLSVFLGLHETIFPLDIRWRGHFWINRYRNSRAVRLY